MRREGGVANLLLHFSGIFPSHGRGHWILAHQRPSTIATTMPRKVNAEARLIHLVRLTELRAAAVRASLANTGCSISAWSVVKKVQSEVFRMFQEQHTIGGSAHSICNPLTGISTVPASETNFTLTGLTSSVPADRPSGRDS